MTRRRRLTKKLLVPRTFPYLHATVWQTRPICNVVRFSLLDKAKPVARRGRKALGLPMEVARLPKG
jgi:hypothetical protein